jgi:putative methionine-R-sulfoxide reductase with GAF domain
MKARGQPNSTTRSRRILIPIGPPFKVKELVIGALDIQSVQPNAFTEE